MNQILLARERLWRAGDLRFKLHKAQVEILDSFLASKGRKFVINSARRLGKSYLLCVLAIEYALKNPNTQIKYAAPTQKMVRRIISPLFRKILKDCPDDIRPDWFAQESRFVFQNGSQIDIAGADAGNSDSLRGTEMHLGIVDEAGFCSDLAYLVLDIMLPMCLTTNGRVILASTPPKTPQHPFEVYWNKALETGDCIKKTIYDNPLITEKDIKEYMAESGGEHTITWRREYLAEFLIDEESIVVPEFRDAAKELIREVKRPEYYDSYVSLDPGYRDLTVALFGYWDFLQGTLVIEDELVLTKARTDLLAMGLKHRETALWGEKKPYFRISDTDLRLIQDLYSLHGIKFSATAKDNKLAQINELRVMVQQRRLVIHPKCKILISHLSSAVWDDTTKDTFARIDGFGHFDAVDALVYMLRNVRRHHNPYPIGRTYSADEFVVFEEKERTQTAKVLERVFRRPRMS